MDTTDFPQWKHESGINNSADLRIRAINVQELKRSEWFTGPAWLKQPEGEWPEQMNLNIASDEESIPTSFFMIQAEEYEAFIQKEHFYFLKRPLNLYRELCANTNQQYL